MGFAATPDGMLYVFGGYGTTGIEGGEGGSGRGASSAVDGAACMGRHHAACTCRTPTDSLSLVRGDKVGREETCRHLSTYAASQWAVYVQLQKKLVRWFELGRDVGLRRGRSRPFIYI
jgi:hypothetical protein